MITGSTHALKADVIRKLELTDVPQVTAIFNEAVEARESTHDPRPRTEEQVAKWLMGDKPQYEAYVYNGPSGVLGWAAITRYHEREAYSPTVELSVYVASMVRRRGIGRRLLTQVYRRAQELAFHSAVMLLFPEAHHALTLVKKLGFNELGRLEGVVQTGNRLRDLVLFQSHLERRDDKYDPIRS